jgi:anti-anti-sigma factor
MTSAGSLAKPRPLRITTESVSPHGAVIAIEGELDLGDIDELRAAITAGLARGHRHLVFDLTDTEFLDCAAIGQLLTSLAPLRTEPDAGILFLRPHGAVARLLELLHFDQLIASAPDRATALDQVHRTDALTDGWRRVP